MKKLRFGCAETRNCGTAVDALLGGTKNLTRLLARDTHVDDHGADDDPAGDGERGHKASPEAEAAEGDEDGIASGECDAGFVRQRGADRDGDEEASGPHECDFEREQKGLAKNGCRLHRSHARPWQRPLVNFTFPHRDDTI